MKQKTPRYWAHQMLCDVFRSDRAEAENICDQFALEIAAGAGIDYAAAEKAAKRIMLSWYGVDFSKTPS